ncbi:MAG: type III polyketide synthase, partial [Alphaproteobacteria bacterium]
MNATTRLVSLATAVPAHVLRQTEVMRWARGLFRTDGEIERLLPAYANAGIETRYSCVPLEWYGQPHGWAEKNRLYIENAVELLERAARGALERAGLAPEAVDSVVTVSTSGIAAPSLDALLVDRLGLRPEVRRLPIFGLGCAGGVLGLA